MLKLYLNRPMLRCVIPNTTFFLQRLCYCDLNFRTLCSGVGGHTILSPLFLLIDSHLCTQYEKSFRCVKGVSFCCSIPDKFSLISDLLKLYRVGVHKLRKWKNCILQGFSAVTFWWEAIEDWCWHLWRDFFLTWSHGTWHPSSSRHRQIRLQQKISHLNF